MLGSKQLGIDSTERKTLEGKEEEEGKASSAGRLSAVSPVGPCSGVCLLPFGALGEQALLLLWVPNDVGEMVLRRVSGWHFR